jgi:Protein of unknown function (DUF4012)
MDKATMEEKPPVVMKPLLERRQGAETQSAEAPTMPLSVVLKESRAQEGPLVEGKPKKKSKKLRSKRFYIIACSFLLLLVVGSGFSFHLYQTYSATYHNDVSLAKTGAQHLQNAVTLLQTLPKNPLDERTVSQAQHEFTASLMIFTQLYQDLQSLPGIATTIPSYGTRLISAQRLLPIAMEVSQAGITGCSLLDTIISRFHDPLKTQQNGLTTTDFASINKDFQQITTTFNLVVRQIKQLQPVDLQLDPRLSKMVATFHKDLPELQGWLANAKQLLTVAPALLGIGTPANYLIELLDSTELRPGGGFIGNYGVVAVSGGRLTGMRIIDTYLLDNAFQAAGHSISYPPAYDWFDLAPASWSLRDSNLDADFPIEARYGESNYEREGGNISLQGVIAITPAFIQKALEITGPIYVPEYHDTVTAQNLIDRIHYYQLGPGRVGNDVPSTGGNSSVRKRFTELLGEHFLARVRQLPASTLPRFAQMFVTSLHSKDVQIYLNSSQAESYLSRYNVDARIASPAGDSLFVVDANISPSKANAYIDNTLTDQVVIDGNGNAIHHTTLNYAWIRPGPVYGLPLYRDYVRVYVPPGSKLQAQNGWEPRGTSLAFGRQVWAGFFTLSYGQAQAITLTWIAPGAAKKNVSGWHYRYLIQRQAGAQWTLHLQIVLPSCAVIKNKSSGLGTSAGNKRAVALTENFNQDLNAGIDYVCGT